MSVPLTLVTFVCMHLIEAMSTKGSIVNGACEVSGKSRFNYSMCPTKHCRQHIDCWVTFGPPQSCICDPHLCGPVCLNENARCPPLAPPVNGTVQYNSTEVGDSAEYACEPGLVVRGPRNRHCLATLMWSGEEPICSNQTNTCFSPPYVPNTQILTEHSDNTLQTPLSTGRHDYRSGESIQIACIPGYEDLKRHSVKATCVGSTWQLDELKCERVSCAPLRDPPHGYVVYKTDLQYKAEALSACVEGFMAQCAGTGLRKESNAGCLRTCQANGQWSGSDVVCLPVTCPTLDPPENGVLSAYSTEVNGVVHIHCNQGYEITGSSKRQCQTNGKWDGEKPRCKERDCGPPPLVTNGNVSFHTTKYGSKARFECVADTTPSAALTELICGVENNVTSWLPKPMPSCNRHCYLFTVDQGEVVLLHAPNTPSQRLIPITADAYSRLDTLAGVSNTPDSQGIILPNGRVRHGSQLNVSCHSGFELAGSQPSTTTCTDGVWSFRIQCIPASCRTRPPAARGARVRFYSRQHNSRARYECFAGRQLRVEKASRMSALMTPPDTVRDPLGTVRCLHGHWMGTPVYCEPITCPELTVEKGIRVELKRIGAEGHNDVVQPTHGTLAMFRCPPGFHITGTPYSVCQVGNWTPPVNPTCTETTHLVIPTEWLFRRP